MSAVAFLFPGQGSQFVGMAADLAEAFPPAAQTLAEADEALGLALSGTLREGPADALTATEVAQPAILAHSVAVWRVLAEAGIEPDWVAGHSLGEYSALVAAGGLDFAAALRLVRERGLAMAAAGLAVPGTMAAVIGLEDEGVEAAVEQAKEVGVVVVANYNSPGQVVISGEPEAVQHTGMLAKAAGARGVMPLKVSGAFHSPLMQPAAQRMQPLLEAAPIADTRVPLVSNVDAEPRQDAAGLREALRRQITGSVRWTASVQRLISAGADLFVEVGPGDVLTRLMKRIAPEAEALATSDLAGVRAALARFS